MCVPASICTLIIMTLECPNDCKRMDLENFGERFKLKTIVPYSASSGTAYQLILSEFSIKGREMQVNNI